MRLRLFVLPPRLRSRLNQYLIYALLAPLLTVIAAPVAKAAPPCVEDTHFTRLSSSGASVLVYRFTNTSECTYVLPTGLASMQILAVGGGGGGGADGGGGGGGGELRFNSSQSLAGVSEIDITVGAGGSGGVWAGAASNSGSSSFVKWGGVTRYEAKGGGGAGFWSTSGPPGGLGGIGGSGGTGTNGQQGGFGPYSTCAAGSSPTGTTPSNSITGSSVNYGGGGGGGIGWPNSSGTAFLGPAGGGTSGGRGANYKLEFNGTTSRTGSTNGAAGTANTGGGGGGGSACDTGGTNGSTQRTAGGAGANGVVIISFSRMSQSITFNSISARNVTAGPVTVAPSSSSGLAVTLTSATPSVCTVSGFTITPVTSGSCTVNANQAGNNNFTAAPQVSQTFAINPVTVTFLSNDGTGNSVTQSIQAPTATLRANTFTRSGMNFVGWSTTSNGTGTNLNDGASVNFATDTSLFARWRGVINYNGNGATSTRTIESTTTIIGESPSSLSTGKLVQGPIVTTGLRINLDASNPASYSGSGSTWRDISGFGFNATLVGAPTWESSTGSFVLNGTSQYFNLGNLAGFSGTTPYTLSVTFKTNEPMKSQSLFTKHNAGVAGYHLLTISSGQTRVAREVSPWEFTNSDYVDPSLVNVYTMTYDGSVMRLYINGVFKQSQSSGSVGTTLAVDSLIGARLTSPNTAIEFFSGRIYNAQVYNRALSDSEVLQNYRALDPSQTLSRTGSTLTGWSTTSDTSTPVIVNSSAPYSDSLPAPYYRLEARNYNGTTWTPTAGSKANLSLTYSSTRPTRNNDRTGWGTTASFSTVSGAAANSVFVRLNNPTLTTYTLCGMARYRSTGVNTPTMGRIFAGDGSNYLAGWHAGGSRNFHNVAWKLQGNVQNDYNWHYFCDSGNRMYWDGVELPPTTRVSTTSLPPLYLGGYGTSEFSDFEIAEVIIYDEFLTTAQIGAVNRYFKNTYGVVAGAIDTATTTLNSSFTYAPGGNETLFARWGSTITYDGNNQSQGVPPAPSVFANGTGTLASNSGNLTQIGRVFFGWNTRADGTGVHYAPGSTYTGGDAVLYANYRTPVQFATSFAAADPSYLQPYMRFKASDYNAVAKVWVDSSGNSRNTSIVKGTPSVVTTSANQNGVTRSFQTVSGGTGDGIRLRNPVMTSGNWTLFAVSRYTSTPTGTARVIDGESANFLFGHHGVNAGVAFYNETWIGTEAQTYGNNWVVSTGYTDTYRAMGSRSSNGLFATVRNSNSAASDNLPALTINDGNSGQYWNWQVAEIIIFDRQLTLTEIQRIEDYLASTYGVAGYTNQNSYPSVISATSAQGFSSVSDSATAIFGLNNQFSFTRTNPGISLNSSGNSASLTMAPTLALGTYFETVTVTDALGNTARMGFQLTVVPPITWSANNPSIATTTLGRQTRIQLDLSGGYGTRRATLNHSSSPIPRAVTLDTSTIASGTVFLVVDTGTAVGSYIESITVTDASGAVRTQILTLIVNPPPDVTYSTATDAPYPYATRNLVLNVDASLLNSYSGTGSTWSDVSLSGRTLSFVNGSNIAVTPTLDLSSGGSFQFDGTYFARMATSLPSMDSYTVEAWFNSSESIPLDEWRVIVSDVWTSNPNKINYYLGLGPVAGQVCGAFYDGSAWSPRVCGAVTTNLWQHASFTVSSKVAGSRTLSLYLNGVLVSTATTSLDPGTSNLGNRIGRRWDSDQSFRGRIGAVRIYNAAMTGEQVLVNFQNSRPRFFGALRATPTNSGRATLNVTEGTSASFPIFTAADGTGAKTFSLSGSNNRVSIDTTTANTALLTVNGLITATNSTTSRTYSETLTAVDSQGIATAYYLSIVVAPRISLIATVDTVTTTFGRVAYDTITSVANTGSGSITLTRTSSSNSSAITHTSTAGSPASAVMTIAGTLPIGTYFETFTATDAVGATSTKVIAIIVNPALALTSNTGSTAVETTFSRAASLRVNLSGGTGTRTVAISSTSSQSSWRISLDTSTIASGFVTLNLGTYASVGSHVVTITASDSLGTSTSLQVTFTVNDYPQLGGVANDFSYNTNGLILNLDAANPASSTGSGNWRDISGAGNSSTFRGSPATTYDANLNGGAFTFNGNANFLTIPNFGTSSSPGISGSLTTYTAEVWARFSTINPAQNSCLICEHYPAVGNNINLALHLDPNGVITGGYYRHSGDLWTRASTAANAVNTTQWHHVVMTVSLTSGSYVIRIFVNGVLSATSAGSANAPLTSNNFYNIGNRWEGTVSTSGTFFNGSIGVIRVYNRPLSAQEVSDNFNDLVPRYRNTAALSATNSFTQGGINSPAPIVASFGTGDKSFSLSPTTSGITLDTSTANQALLQYGAGLTSVDTRTARTINQTLTATDSLGVTTSFRVTTVVNPPIIETATTTNLTTTSGIETSTVVFASQGTGDKTFSRSGTSSGGVTLTPGTNQATLRILSTINPGSYWETVTATDVSGATTSLAIRVVVNPPPTIVGRATLNSPVRTSFASPAYYGLNGTGALRFSMNPTNIPGITLDTTTTVNAAYIRVANTILNPGVFYETLTVTDINGATGSLVVTIRINPILELTGNTSVTSTYGDSNLFSYSTNSSGGFNVMVTSQCIVTRSTYVGDGTNGTNGVSFTVEQLTGANKDNTCQYVVPQGVTSLTGLVIAGGGQGGFGRGGGGGAGALATGTIAVSPGDVLTVRVGVGGSAILCGGPSSYTNGWAGCDGTNTIIGYGANSNFIVTSGGGGGGGPEVTNGRNGGSGGGGGFNYASGDSRTNAPVAGSASATNTVPAGWSVFGNNGGTTSDREGTPAGSTFRNTGGGGGAGAAGTGGACTNASPACNNTGTGGGTRPDGGDGRASSITGVNTFYAGGGGGAVGIGFGGGSAETAYLSAPAGNSNAATYAAKGGAGVGGRPTAGNDVGTDARPNSGSGGGGSNPYVPTLNSNYSSEGGNGGSGLVIFRYQTPTAAQASNRIRFEMVDTDSGRFTMTVPESVTVGTYSQTVFVSPAKNAANTITTATITVQVLQDTPTVTLSLPGSVNTATYGSPITISAVSSTQGTVNFRRAGSTITGCGSVSIATGLATCTWTPSTVETTTITAILTPTDSINYRTSIEAESNFIVVVGRADTLTVIAGDLSATYAVNVSDSAITTIPQRTVTFQGLASIDSITAVTYTFDGTTNAGITYSPSTTPPLQAGTYFIVPSGPVFAGSGSINNYRAVTFVSGRLTINRASRGNWTSSYNSGTNVTTYGAGKIETVSVSAPGDGGRRFTTSSQTCSVDQSSGALTTLSVGPCVITVVLLQTANWVSDTRSVTVTINRGPRTSSITPAQLAIRYGETTSVTSAISPALDSATVTYSAGSSLGCEVDNVTGTVTGSRALTSCTVSISYSQTNLYESTTATASITVNRALAPVVTTETLTAVSYTGSSVIVAPSYRVSGILARDIRAILPLVDVSSESAIATIAASSYTAVGQYRFTAITPTSYDSTTAPILGGTYAVSAQNLTLLGGLNISNYETPTYLPANLVIAPIAQSRVTIQLSYLETITVPFDVSISGGSSSAAPTLTVLPGGTAQGCVVDLAVSAMRLKSSSPGTCIIQVTKPADRNFLIALSDTQVVTILNFVAPVPQFLDFSTGISINTVVPFTVGDSSCLVDCVPTITAVQDMNGVDMTDMKAGVPFRILGTNFNTATRVLFSAVIGGTMNSGVDADSFLIDNDSQITVIPPVTFQPNGTDVSSSIQVRIFVVASGGQSFPNRSIRTISR